MVSAACRRNVRAPMSDEMRQKVSQRSIEMHAKMKETDPDYRDRQKRTAAKMRAAKGDNFRHSDETREKMRGPRPSTAGVPKSEAHKAKMSAARMGRKTGPHAPETIEKMRKAWKRRKADKEAYASYISEVSKRMSTDEMITALRNRIAPRIKAGEHNARCVHRP